MSQRQRQQWAVRGVLVFGLAASTVANVLHALPDPISRAIAAWPPLALLLTIEIIARIRVHRRVLSVARICATAVIAGIAAWVSYWHMAGVAARYGEQGASPFLLPLSVDGLIVVASICLVELGGRTRTPPEPPVAQPPAVRVTGPVFDHPRPIGPMPEHPRPTGNVPGGTDSGADSAGGRPWQDPRSEQEREAAVCAMRAVTPKASLRQISTATLVPVSTVRNILNRAAAQNQPPSESKVNGKVPDLEGVK